MEASAAVATVIDALNQLGVNYMIVGSYSSNMYGIDRSTRDADFVVQIDQDTIPSLRTLLGPEFHIDQQMSFETVTLSSRFRVQVKDSTFEIELFVLREEPFEQERFRRRRPVELLNRPTFVASAEDVLLKKLQWYSIGRRSKDRDDIQNVLAVQKDAIDLDYVHKWCDVHGTRALLDEIRASIPMI